MQHPMDASKLVQINILRKSLRCEFTSRVSGLTSPQIFRRLIVPNSPQIEYILFGNMHLESYVDNTDTHA